MRWVQLCSSLSILWHCLSLGLEWKLTFSSPVATAEFSKFAGILKCSAFTASSSRIWNSSTGIPSPPLALFVVVLPKAHLTSHSRMSGSRCDHSIMIIWYYDRKLVNFITRTTALSNSMKLSHATWGNPRQMGHGGEFWQNVVHWRREWQTTSVFLPWEPHEQYEKAKR